MQCSTDRLQAVLYLLLRDEVSFGKMERIVADMEASGNEDKFLFSESTQATYAYKMAKRILWE